MRTRSFFRAIASIGICMQALAWTVPEFTAEQVTARLDRDLFFPRLDIATISRSQENEGSRGSGGRAQESGQPVGPVFQADGQEIKGTRNVSCQQARIIIQEHRRDPDFVILDFRAEDMFVGSHIPGAIYHDVFSADIDGWLRSLDKQMVYLIYCTAGQRSGIALTKMKEMGFINVLHMREGLGRWISLGYETVSGKDLSDLAAFPIQDRQVAVEDPSSLEKVVLEINNGHPAEALKLSATLAAKDPGHPGILTAHGLALLGCGEFLKAQALFEQAVKLDPGNPDAHLGLGELASGRLRLDEASKHLEVAVDSSYFRLRALQSYAKCLHDLGRHAEAKIALQRALTEVDRISERERRNIENSIEIYGALGNTRLFQIPDSFQTTSLDFSTHEANIIMPVELNGRKSVKFQLDLGMSGDLAISQALADELGLKVIGEEIGGNVAQEYKTKVGLIDSLRMGDLVVRNVLVHSLPDPKFIGGSDGNLGKAIFQKMNISIDYPRSVLFLFNRDEPALQSGRMDPGRISEGIPFWNKNHILVFARINDMEPTPLIFDTGASVPVLNLDYYLDHIDPKAQVPVPKEGQPKALPFLMKSLAIGGLTFTQIFCVAMDLSFIFEIGKMNYPGIIGASVLQGSIVHINFGDSVMFIEKPAISQRSD
jgi:rhodanese-related sulfurtransferase